MSKEAMIQYWLEKAQEDIASARGNFSEGRLQNTVRDAYFACFHALAALLLKDGKSFKKHKEARSALHRDYVRTSRRLFRCFRVLVSSDTRQPIVIMLNCMAQP